MESNKKKTTSNITKQIMCKQVGKEMRITQDDCRKILEDVLEAIEYFVATDEKVKVLNFGTFRAYETKERLVNIPPQKKGEKILGKKNLESRFIFKFKPSLKKQNTLNKAKTKEVF